MNDAKVLESLHRAIRVVAQQAGVRDSSEVAALDGYVDLTGLAALITEAANEQSWVDHLAFISERDEKVLLIVREPSGDYRVMWPGGARNATLGGPTATEIESLLNVIGVRR